MKTLRVLIADDEPLAREGLALLLREIPGISVVANCGDGQSALAHIREMRPDVAFLDVHMPQLGGLDVYQQVPLGARPVVVFVTAYQDHAIKAFELSAVDYIVKPFTDDRFKHAVARARERVLQADIEGVRERVDELVTKLKVIEQKMADPETARPKRLALKIGSGVVLVYQRDVVLLEASGESVQIRVNGQNHFVRSSLSSLEAELDPQIFVRVHRSFIVNTRFVKKLTPVMYGDYDVWLEDGSKVRMSRTYRDRIPQLINPGE